MQVAFSQGEQFIGQTLGPYKLESLIGQGQWNAVYQAQQQTHSRSVLLTLFFLPETYSASARKRFIDRLYREGAMLVKLDHPHILPLLDVGDHDGYTYAVTPLIPGTSLAQVLHHQGYFSPEQALEVVKPLMEALNYAHGTGVTHGAISAANVLFDADKQIRLARFGFNRLGSIQGIEMALSPYPHLLSITSTPLPGIEYFAPEVIQGALANPLADIYATGLLLFELLTGELPFKKVNSLDDVQQRVQFDVPAPSSIRPAISPHIDLVIQQATQRDPAQRIQTADQLARAFEKALYTPTPHSTLQPDQPAVAQNNDGTLDWVNQELPMQTAGAASAAFAEGITASSIKTPRMQQTAKPAKSRRRVLALLATGGVASAAVLGLGSVGMAYVFRSQPSPSSPTANVKNPTATAPAVSTPEPTKVVKKDVTPTPQTNPQAQPTTAPLQVTQTAAPTPPPAPAATGTVIGSTSMAINTAANFTNPADRDASILIHLPDGNFVAYETACTHKRVPVYYDSGSHTLVCPAHGAIFDPAQGGAAIRGPATRALSTVTIHINADGTITTG
ncbi:protein kinase domain-containing protein [Dictyobacter aurantiacus]|uniref:non-specific serine/threonine protein kinase n=1 Tax=Dictyobacter aurantiacus TaxID=1936993 RepID=A0A401ZIX7_9CHLR|nr:protein kinase [Dictyobacter aurantiacus]GCE06805.1 hypothetical protein KDAU_41340 [Dictyobacter aurantiacus]